MRIWDFGIRIYFETYLIMSSSMRGLCPVEFVERLEKSGGVTWRLSATYAEYCSTSDLEFD